MRFQFAPQDLIGIVKRRFFWAMVPFLVFASLGLFIISLMPPVYKSTARLIVEDQQVKNSWVQSAVASDALQRVEAVSARVRARDNLLILANELDLYRNEGLNAPARATKMQRNVEIMAERTRMRRGNNNSSAITISIGFHSSDPAQAQKVANRLLTTFVNRSIELRTEIADDTTTFLREEEEKVRRNLDRVIEGISAIKQENPRALPENRSLYERSLERAISSQSRVDGQLEQTYQEIRLLEMQAPLLLQSSTSLSTEEQELRQKRRTLEALEREYTDTYPDVVAMREEVLALEVDVDPASFRRRATKEVSSLTSQREDAAPGSRTYERLTARIDNLNEKLANLPRQTRTTSLSEVQYNAQMSALRGRIDGLNRQRDETIEQILDLETRLAAIPAVEGQLYRLEQEQLQLEQELSGIRRNRGDAERSESLEEQAKAERFSVLEQPILPDQPISPDKPKLAILAFAVAGGLAAVIALLPEVLFARVRAKHHLAEMLPNTRIVEVPRFKSKQARIPQFAHLAVGTALTLAFGATFAWMALETLI
ncbi:MAG: Wzz/FepE/Etk N-terminal domain-containing protein [Pseudomonadota bacterium]